MTKPRSLSIDGLDYLDSRPTSQPKTGVASSQLSESRLPAQKPASQKHKLTVQLPEELLERLRNAAYWNPGLTISDIIDLGATLALQKLEAQNGGPFKKRERELRPGRPIR